MQNLATHLTSCLETAGLKQADIVTATDLDPSQVSRIFSGNRRPSASQLASIADALGLTDRQRARLLEAAR